LWFSWFLEECKAANVLDSCKNISKIFQNFD
jgi:hypothetical protein